MLNPLGQALLSMLQSNSTQGQPLLLKHLVGLVDNLKYSSMENSLFKEEMLILLGFFSPLRNLSIYQHLLDPFLDLGYVPHPGGEILHHKYGTISITKLFRCFKNMQ